MPVNVSIMVLLSTLGRHCRYDVFGTKCQIELVKDNGDIIQITDIASDTIEEVIDKGSVIADEVKEKGSEVISNVKAKANEAISKATKKAEEEKCECEGCSCNNSEDN